MGFLEEWVKQQQMSAASKSIKCDSGNFRLYWQISDGSGKCPWCGKNISGEAIQELKKGWTGVSVGTTYCSVRCFKKAN
ncbi:MAG: hypothetical protein IKO34_11115 [Bacteroidales bacterium]|nr:hypothetical protein [Bacteroidales bacterium]